MVLNSLTIEVRRTGNTAKLVVTGFYALQTDLTLPQLKALALELASEVGEWSDSLLSIETESRT